MKPPSGGRETMIQIVKMTHKQRVEMYIKKCTKKQLAEMLANCNEILEQITPLVYGRKFD